MAITIEKKYFENLGNGNLSKGLELFYDLALGLEQARILHPASEWQEKGKQGAADAIEEEAQELIFELECEDENLKKIKNESLDGMIVCVRTYLEEWRPS